MWLIPKTAWRNLFRQKRRTFITVSAMAVSLMMAIPTWGLVDGLSAQMLHGITRMELGHIQIHDPAYARGRALQSTLRRPRALLAKVRKTPGVEVAAPRVHGNALASHDVKLSVELVALKSLEALKGKVRFGTPIDEKAPWRKDVALACEAVVGREAASRNAVVVGTVLTPEAAQSGGRCERIRVVGLVDGTLPGETEGRGFSVGLAAADMETVFGGNRKKTEAVVRHAAPLAIEGVEPDSEREVTFMADKVIEGRYLSSSAKGEMVVGKRLAETMRLGLGDEIFVQAASLDQTRGAFYRDFKVVGIYKTGVDMLDRTRVFVHLKDAQKILSLGDRIHEIVVIGPHAKKTSSLAKALKGRVESLGLEVTQEPVGSRAGSAPLPAPVYVVQLKDGEAELLVPYDLKRRFDGVNGVKALAKRVYGEVDLAPSETVRVRLLKATPQRLETLKPGLPATVSLSKKKRDCAVWAPREWARSKGIKRGDTLLTRDGALGLEPMCPEVVVAGLYDAGKFLKKGSKGSPDAGETAEEGAPLPVFLIPPASDGGSKTTDDDADLAGLEEGELAFMFKKRGRRVRFVGVEPVYEKQLSSLHEKVSKGRYPNGNGPGGMDAEEKGWPVLMKAARARALGLKVGSEALITTRDVDGGRREQVVHVVGLLKDSAWGPKLPPLVLSYYSAQQVDAKRLNARAHEVLLIPKKGVDPKELASRASVGLAPVVRTWQEISPDMAKLIETQEVWVGILLFVIFAMAAMTVMNTMLMAVWERTKEFGVLKSIGMKPRQVFGLIVFETLGLAIFASIFGGAVGFSLDYYLVVEGLDLTAFTGGFTYQGTFIDPVWRAVFTLKSVFFPIFMVALVCLLVSFYPAFRAGRLEPVKALRHNT